MGAAAACVDPADDALEALSAATNGLLDELEASGAPLDTKALEAWTARVGPDLIATVRESTRALGPARRRALEEAWGALSERLRKRLAGIGRDHEDP